MISFTDFMRWSEPSRTKVKFNIRAGDSGAPAWDLLQADDQEDWLNMTRHRRVHANNNLGNAEYVMAFAQYYPYGPRYFIFGGLFRVAKAVPEIIDGPGYQLTLLDQYSEYIKRLVVKLGQPIGRDLYLRQYEGLQAGPLNPEVHELAADTKLGSFPGYQNVRLRHHEMQRIIAGDEPSWRNALSSVKGVYVITDLSNGRLYVGSASGAADGLWQRWAGYAHLQNLTNNNKEFVQLRDALGEQHIIDNFQYSILEIFDPKAKTETVLLREAFWKNALDSRKHGMNWN